jgi:D-alanyl-D-alanine dipeptidase
MAIKFPSITEPVSDLRRVKIRENGEPLVDFLAECPELRLDKPRFLYRRETMLRQSVAERLCRANDRLMRQGRRIYIVEGWRAPLIQRRMYAAAWQRYSRLYPDRSPTSLKRIVNRFTAPVGTAVPPPHSTGGAMDIVLYDMEGNALDVRSPYEWRDPDGFAFAAPKLTEEARRNRDTLAEAMTAEGITNYPSEYWHWSYGDQGWAYRGGHDFAVYGPIEPPGWTPDPADVRDDALTWIAAPEA